MAEKIGILAGWEQSMPQAFIERCNKVPGIKAEFATIGGTPERFACPYRVLVDRISQEVKHYRFYLKAAALAGSFVINDPLWWSADDKFFGYSLVSRIGIATPRTVMLPQKDYIPAIDKRRSLRNLHPLHLSRLDLDTAARTSQKPVPKPKPKPKRGSTRGVSRLPSCSLGFRPPRPEAVVAVAVRSELIS